MRFYKFECDSEAVAQSCIAEGSFPPYIPKSPPYADSYSQTRAKVSPLDAVILATLEGRAARFFAVGKVIRCPDLDGEGEVAWVCTPDKVETVRPNGAHNWREKTAFEISSRTGVPYGLREVIAQREIGWLSSSARGEFIAFMRDEGYTENRLEVAPYICDLLSKLMGEGFDVFSRGDGKDEEQGTITVASNGCPVAYVPSGKEQAWNHLIGVPVLWPGKPKPQQKVPADFELDKFAREHDVDASHLLLVPPGAKERYIRITDINTAHVLIHRMASLWDENYVPPEGLGREATQEDDEREVRERHAARSPATCRKLILARRGQGTYRAALLRKYDGRCAVTGLSLRQALRASHILAWRRCETDVERLDPNNGLLLSADLDALFDRYLITFDRDGKLMRSPKLKDHLVHQWPLGDLRRRPTNEQYAYLKKHNEVFERLARR